MLHLISVIDVRYGLISWVEEFIHLLALRPQKMLGSIRLVYLIFITFYSFCFLLFFLLIVHCCISLALENLCGAIALIACWILVLNNGLRDHFLSPVMTYNKKASSVSYL